MQVRLTPQAATDLARLDAFLRSKDPRAADRLTANLFAAFDRLSEHPSLGRPATAPERVRELVARFGRRAYVIRYRVEPDAILIARVWHGRERRD